MRTGTTPVLFDGVLDPRGGVLFPEMDRPGAGLELKAADAAPYRVEGTEGKGIS